MVKPNYSYKFETPKSYAPDSLENIKKSERVKVMNHQSWTVNHDSGTMSLDPGMVLLQRQNFYYDMMYLFEHKSFFYCDRLLR